MKIDACFFYDFYFFSEISDRTDRIGMTDSLVRFYDSPNFRKITHKYENGFICIEIMQLVL